MKKKIVLGTSFIILFFSLIIFFYFKSNNEKRLIEEEKKVQLVENENLELIEEKIESSNIIEDVSYSAKDTKGNEYFLQASEGIIDQNDSNFIFLTSVTANIKLKNYKLIEISSDFGKYNINNYDTIFSKNVIIKYLDNVIKGDYLDFSLDKKLMTISRDVTLNNDAVNKFFLSINNLRDFGIIAPISQNEKYNNFNINEDKEIKEVDNVKGFAMFLNMKNLKQINFFDDNFFLYFEEIDLCRRLKKNNSKIFIDPTIKVSHLGGTSHNSEIEKPMELSRNWHWMWSTFYFHKKHYGYLSAIIKILPKLSSSLIKFIIFLITFQKYKSEIYKHRLSGIINSVLLKKSWYRPKL